MPVLVWGMIIGGVAALAAGLILVRDRFRAASGADRLLVLGPVFEAVGLAMFAAEHFFAAGQLMGLVPKWLPGALFWTYFFGAGLLAAAVSFIAWRCVRWSAPLLALFFLLIVATVDLPQLSRSLHVRLFWTLTFREAAFAGGAMVLAGSVFARESSFAKPLIVIGRAIVAITMIFYGAQHFFFPGFVPGVPLEKPMPAWMPAPTLLAYFVGATLVLAGVGLFIRRTISVAAAGSGAVLVLLTAFFYLPILLLQLHTPNAVEGLNYVGDTLLFAATVLLTGLAADRPFIRS
jgi:uncharacterized membrane protein